MSSPCRRLDAGAHWPTARTGSVFASAGTGFDITISVLGEGEQPMPPEVLGEEVATILEGSFDVDAAGEQYRLTRGEGIIIPPGEPRDWVCAAPRGVLYRVVVTTPALADG